ncbi:HNH endonuclease signature motif containing protein [Streptomyces sp. NPDC051219]|uniref:HNH endonuclease n=1 Tax=Streptomyces sp. NPDC051219 TaxID=3155283 RepID=UPI00341BE5FA
MGRKRRRFMIWEWLAVLFANDGQCFWCSNPSQTMDHVIPFSDGGLDDLPNLLPICHKCNRAKSDKNPVVWLVSMDLCIRWDGKGTPRDGAMYKDSSLRDLYLSAHTDVLDVLDQIDEVLAEITDEKRIAWFNDRYKSYGYPSASYGVPRARAAAEKRVKKGKEKGYPDLNVEVKELLASRGIDTSTFDL